MDNPTWQDLFEVARFAHRPVGDLAKLSPEVISKVLEIIRAKRDNSE